MAGGSITSDDRLDIKELFARYSRSFDTGDIDAYVLNFTADGVLDLPGGRRFVGHAQIRDYVQRTTGTPTFRGRQHRAYQLIFEGNLPRCSVLSYALGAHCIGPGVTPNAVCTLFHLGHYRDVCVKLAGKWLFAERIYRDWEGDILAGVTH